VVRVTTFSSVSGDSVDYVTVTTDNFSDSNANQMMSPALFQTPTAANSAVVVFFAGVDDDGGGEAAGNGADVGIPRALVLPHSVHCLSYFPSTLVQYLSIAASVSDVTEM